MDRRIVINPYIASKEMAIIYTGRIHTSNCRNFVLEGRIKASANDNLQEKLAIARRSYSQLVPH